MKKNILLISPPIYDFAAFNLWARPLGLLYLANILKKLGLNITVIDALSLDYEKDLTLFSKNIIKSKKKYFSTYHYYKEVTDKPEIYKNIKRKYYRFGINSYILKQLTMKINKPDLILMTSQMTYWYKGVFEFIDVLKKIYPDVKIILGGTYARLCREHAVKYSKADHVFNNDISEIINFISQIFNNNKIFEFYKKKFSDQRYLLFQVYPFYECYSNNDFLPFLTSVGCVYSCKYCASRLLYPHIIEKKSIDMINELTFYINKYNVKDISFYDDALLINKNSRVIPFLKFIIENKININFHTPNGLHINSLDQETALLLKQSGFKTLRFGFESNITKFQRDSDCKTDNSSFKNALKFLFNAGFIKNQIGVYILMGLPGQTVDDVIKTIRYIKKFDVSCKLCEYSPIPGTYYFNDALKISKIDFTNEPLYHNNTALELWHPVFNESVIKELKDMAG
ncbi:MAG: radical SAM protein [Spirochaetes bacterium]|nr:radical SAM protein [Spirochaetota bacterium]